MAKANGVGGVFLKFHGDDKQIRDWYETNLGLDMSPYGTGFIKGDQLMLVSFKRGDDPTTPSINFRVDDLRTLLGNLVISGAKITSQLQEYPYGLFAQICDPFGNYVELWEPYEDEYRRMVETEIKAYKEKASSE